MTKTIKAMPQDASPIIKTRLHLIVLEPDVLTLAGRWATVENGILMHAPSRFPEERSRQSVDVVVVD